MAEETTPSSSKSGPWIPLESNPDVFNSWAKKLGMADTAHFEDIYGFDPELLDMVSQPVRAVLMIFPIDKKIQEQQAVQDRKESLHVDPSITFIEQKILNACGTIGLLHALLNSKITFSPISPLEKFLQECISLSPSQRADLLAKTTLFEQAHTTAATSSQSNSTVPTNLNTNLHFSCFTRSSSAQDPTKKRLIELDGRRKGPVDHGACDDLLKDVAAVVKEKYMSLSNSLNFGLVALCGD